MSTKKNDHLTTTAPDIDKLVSAGEFYEATLETLENRCKAIVAADQADAGKFVDDTLRYLGSVRREIKRFARVTAKAAAGKTAV